MACFVVPLVQALATAVVRRTVGESGNSVFLRKLSSLEKMLWGGTLMLVADHVASGELVFRFPFFTALTVPGGPETMIREMLTVGLPMSALVTSVWMCMCLYGKYFHLKTEMK